MKEPKIYFFDTGLINGDRGVKFENFSAICLLKHVIAKIDYQARRYMLQYLRTKDGTEVDFAIVEEKEVEKIVEVKVSDPSPSKGIRYFQKKYGYSACQVVKELQRERVESQIEVLDAKHFFESLDI